MTDPVSAAGAQPPQGSFSLFDLPAQQGNGGFVSSMGDSAISSIEAMQETFRANAADMQTGDDPSSYFQTDATEAVDRSESTLMRVVEGLEHSMTMQADLAQFVMLSSVTSAFGKNLNSFLRGQ